MLWLMGSHRKSENSLITAVALKANEVDKSSLISFSNFTEMHSSVPTNRSTLNPPKFILKERDDSIL